MEDHKQFGFYSKSNEQVLNILIFTYFIYMIGLYFKMLLMYFHKLALTTMWKVDCKESRLKVVEMMLVGFGVEDRVC